MTCSELEPFLHTYLDDELEASDRAEVDRHLAGCDACAAALQHQLQWQSAIRSKLASAPVAAPERLRASLQSSIRVERRRATFRRFGAFSAVAALLAIGASAALWVQRPMARKRWAADAASRHARKFPLEVQKASAAELEGWFDGKLDHRVAVPSLSHAAPAGARLLNVHEKQAAYISYDTDGATGRGPRQVGLFVFADQQNDAPFEPLPAAEVASSNGYNVVSWRDGDLVYQLVSDLDEADIRRMLAGGAAPAAPPPTGLVQPASLRAP